MKKLLFTIALLITLSVATNAQNDGFFKWNGNDEDDIFRDVTTSGLVLPSTHGDIHDYNAPVGSGIAILTLLGAGYAIKRRRKNC
ncbi:MAG: hypothetical protein II401_06475 [Bacteroidales bacterium]|nr:hypothetical protein [Bacteroidales bacterium]